MILQHCLKLLGWQGGTIHQVNEELQNTAVIIHTVCGVSKGIVDWVESGQIQILTPGIGAGVKQIEGNMIVEIKYNTQFTVAKCKDVSEG